jgi:hypothetical protein
MIVFGLGKLLKRPCIAIIDLGTANVRIYVPGRGIVVDAPSIIESASEKEVTSTGWQQMEHKGVEVTVFLHFETGLLLMSMLQYVCSNPCLEALGASVLCSPG